LLPRRVFARAILPRRLRVDAAIAELEDAEFHRALDRRGSADGAIDLAVGLLRR
jgi:hypothetical protein